MAIDSAPRCRWCGHIHGDLCPQVKALEFAEDGVRVTRVEFITPIDRPPLKIDDWKGEKP